MKLLILAIFSLQIAVISGQLIMPPTVYYNRSSNTSLRRSTRSLIGTKKDDAKQRCIGCTDESQGHCAQATDMFITKVRRYAEKLKCKPESILVKLEAPAPYLSLEPPMARVKRCSGYCRPGYHTCLPVKTTFVRIPVILRNHQMGSTKCVEYEVEQHQECGCDCEIRKEHCSELHTHHRCYCKCQNEAEKHQCLEEYSLNKKIWNEEICECQCEAESCEVGFMWNAKQCRCEMVSPSDIENLLY